MKNKNSNYKNRKQKNLWKRLKHKGLIFFILMIGIWCFNNFTLSVNKQSYYSGKVSNNVKIVFMSDLHISNFSIGNKKIIKKVTKEKPDIVCILGDMYTNNSGGESMKKAIDLASDIKALGYPVYLVVGEHDRQVVYCDALRAKGINVLNYNTDYITIGNTEISISGIDNAYFSPTYDINKNLPQPSANTFNILLAHIPNFSQYSSFGADLTLCGDTHGGLIQIPFLGVLYSNDMLLPELRTNNTIYDKGAFPYPNGEMFITSGIGNYPLPLRFNNLPEIVSMTIYSSKT